MSLYLDIKALIVKSGMNLTQVNNELNRRNGTDYSVQNFGKRLRVESVSYKYIEQILDILDYKIDWIPKDNS